MAKIEIIVTNGLYSQDCVEINGNYLTTYQENIFYDVFPSFRNEYISLKKSLPDPHFNPFVPTKSIMRYIKSDDYQMFLAAIR